MSKTVARSSFNLPDHLDRHYADVGGYSRFRYLLENTTEVNAWPLAEVIAGHFKVSHRQAYRWTRMYLTTIVLTPYEVRALSDFLAKPNSIDDWNLPLRSIRDKLTEKAYE